MWGMKTTTVPVEIGAMGIPKKRMEKYIQNIPGNIQIKEPKKITLLGTSHIIRKVLFIKQTFNESQP